MRDPLGAIESRLATEFQTMSDTSSTHEISSQGKLLVTDRLRALGFQVVAAPRGTGHHLLIRRDGTAPQQSMWLSTNVRPKPAGGKGPPALNWKIPRTVRSDWVALTDLSRKRVWLLKAGEAQSIAQQHNASYHHMVMVVQSGWTSAPHERIRDDQFDHLLLERRVAELAGDGA
jgi:hypothetical protein